MFSAVMGAEVVVVKLQGGPSFCSVLAAELRALTGPHSCAAVDASSGGEGSSMSLMSLRFTQGGLRIWQLWAGSLLGPHICELTNPPQGLGWRVSLTPGCRCTRG